MRFFTSLFLFLVTSFAFGQQSYIRPMGMDVVGDASQFPAKPYVQVVSYSFNRDTVTKKRFLNAIREFEKYQKKDSLKADSLIQVIAELDSVLHSWSSWNAGILVNNKISENAEEVKALDQNELKRIQRLISPSIDSTIEPSIDCMVKYRDGLIFLNEKNEIVGTIEFCFACLSSRFSGERNYYLKRKQLFEIKKFFKEQLGNPVDFHPY